MAANRMAARKRGPNNESVRLSTPEREHQENVLTSIVTPDKVSEYHETYKLYKKHDPALSFLQQPHTISLLIGCGVLLVYYAFREQAVSDLATNVKTGLMASAGVFLLFSMLQMRDGLFVRPHKAFWRVIMGLAVIYLVLLVFLLFQTVDDARQLLAYYDPALGKPLPEVSYAEDCRFYTPENPHNKFANIWHAVHDHFIVAHLLGWWGKAVLMRDAYVCWALSIMFEFFEFSLQHWLPNFAECWWDQLILDVLLCNGVGIWLGMKTCRYLELREYDWAGMGQTKKVILRSITQFTPERFDPFQWHILSSPKRFLSILLLILMWSTVELNTFFLKYALWIPPPHSLVVGRLWLWWFICFPALREYYQFVADPTCNKFGTMAWLASAIMGTELLINIKFGRGLYTAATPPHILYAWGIWFAALILFFVVYFGFIKKGNSTEATAVPTAVPTRTRSAPKISASGRQASKGSLSK